MATPSTAIRKSATEAPSHPVAPSTSVPKTPVGRTAPVARPLAKNRCPECHEKFKGEQGVKLHQYRAHGAGKNRVYKRKAKHNRTTMRGKTTRGTTTLKTYRNDAKRQQMLRKVSVSASKVVRNGAISNERFDTLQKWWTKRASNETNPLVSAAIIECLLDLTKEFK